MFWLGWGIKWSFCATCWILVCWWFLFWSLSLYGGCISIMCFMCIWWIFICCMVLFIWRCCVWGLVMRIWWFCGQLWLSFWLMSSMNCFFCCCCMMWVKGVWVMRRLGRLCFGWDWSCFRWIVSVYWFESICFWFCWFKCEICMMCLYGVIWFGWWVIVEHWWCCMWWCGWTCCWLIWICWLCGRFCCCNNFMCVLMFWWNKGWMCFWMKWVL